MPPVILALRNVNAEIMLAISYNIGGWYIIFWKNNLLRFLRLHDSSAHHVYMHHLNAILSVFHLSGIVYRFIPYRRCRAEWPETTSYGFTLGEIFRAGGIRCGEDGDEGF